MFLELVKANAKNHLVGTWNMEQHGTTSVKDSFQI